MIKYTEKTINFIKKHYPLKGSDFCAEKLNLTRIIIQGLAWRNGIKFIRPKVDCFCIIHPKSVEAAYFLGLLWADGHIRFKPRQYKTGLFILTSDFIGVKKQILDKFHIHWCLYERIRKNRQPLSGFLLFSKDLASFLKKHNYTSKDKSANSIVKLIPKKFRYAFFLGLFDGDGCWYISKNKKTRQLSCSSSFNQNWSFLKELFIRLKIKYYIKQKRSKQKDGKIHSTSVIQVFKINDIVKFGDYLYQNYHNDKIGFNRKYKKFLEIKKIRDKINGRK